MCYAYNWFSPVSWYVLFKTLGIHDINKIKINQKNVKGFLVLGRSCSTSLHNVLLSNTHQSLFCVVYIIDILLCHNTPAQAQAPTREEKNSRRFPTVKSKANNFKRLCLRLVHTLDLLATVALSLIDCKTAN